MDYKKPFSKIKSTLFIAATMSLVACGGGSDTEAETPIPPVVQNQMDLHLAAATLNTGGDKFLKDWTRDRYCMYVDNPALLAQIRTQTAPVPMTQIFDDVWFVGFQNVGQFILKNASGFSLIDTLNRADDVDTYTVPALQSLGLRAGDPLLGAFISHGHFDHDGGADRLRSLFGSDFPLYLGDGDAEGKTYAPILLDSSNLGYQRLNLGGRDLTILASPGHTPGTMSAIVPVNYKGVEYKLLVVGGTAIPKNIQASREYLKSVERMYTAAKDFNLDGTLHPHGIIDGGNHYMDEINNNNPENNPFLIGNDKLLRTIAIMRECAAAQIGQVAPEEKEPVWRVTSITSDNHAVNRLSAKISTDWGPVVGREMVFDVHTSNFQCKAVTDSKGVASCTTTFTPSPLDEVTASFAGDSDVDYVNLPSRHVILAPQH